VGSLQDGGACLQLIIASKQIYKYSTALATDVFLRSFPLYLAEYTNNPIAASIISNMRLLAAFAILSSFVAFASALDAPVAARDVDADAEAARTALKEELKLAASLALHENRDISIEDRSDVGSVSDSMLEDRALTTCPDKNGCTCKKTQQGQVSTRRP